MRAHPLSRLTPRARALALVALMVGVVWVGVPLRDADRRLTARPGGDGIVAFELAGDGPTAADLLDRWGDEGQDVARTSLRWDMAWLVLYSTALAVAAVMAAGALGRVGWRRVAAVGPAVAWGAWVAGLLDAVENVLLWLVLDGGARQPHLRLARLAASLKFGLVALALAYAVVGLAATLTARARSMSL